MQDIRFFCVLSKIMSLICVFEIMQITHLSKFGELCSQGTWVRLIDLTFCYGCNILFKMEIINQVCVLLCVCYQSLEKTTGLLVMLCLCLYDSFSIKAVMFLFLWLLCIFYNNLLWICWCHLQMGCYPCASFDLSNNHSKRATSPNGLNGINQIALSGLWDLVQTSELLFISH